MVTGKEISLSRISLSIYDLLIVSLRPPIHAMIPAGLSDLITQCWSPKASDRPSMSEVLSRLEKISEEEDLSNLNARPGGAGCSDFCSIQ